MSDQIGPVLRWRYRVAGFLGRGGMIEVYKFWDQEMMVHLAMKVLYEDTQTNQFS